ncbi:hypothetical protein I7I50_03898 [Histoplasma capsulatum G186AR]|nr:hypothetical protein I7I50_03898 [Histoplasma capsulatum G186AR]
MNTLRSNLVGGQLFPEDRTWSFFFFFPFFFFFFFQTANCPFGEYVHRAVYAPGTTHRKLKSAREGRLHPLHFPQRES